MKRGLALPIAIAWLASPWLVAQVRDTHVLPERGNGIVSGKIVSAGNNATPLSHVRVTLTDRAIGVSRLVITDATGAFRFAELPPGRFRLSAAKPAYVSAEYGAKRLEGPGVSIVLAAGQSVTGLTIRLQKGSVITGRITDASGAAVPRLGVAVRRPAVPSMLVDGVAVTDPRGEYRIFGLAPGTYVVSVSVGGSNIQKLSAAEIDAALQPSGPASLTRSPKIAPPRDEFSFVPIYHPGTPVAADTVPVTLSPGEERDGVNIRVDLVRAARLSGTVFGLDGAPTGGVQVRLLAGPSSAPVTTTTSVEPAAPGTFALPGVAPGRYTLLAWVARSGASGAASLVALGGTATASAVSASAAYWASTELRVNGQDVTGVNLQLQRGMNISGRLVFDTATATPFEATSWSVALTPMLSDVEVAIRPPATKVDAGGRFTIEGITPARYRLSASSPQNGDGRRWFVRSATVQGREIGDVPFTLGPGENLAGVVVTLTDRAAALDGTLVNAAGQAAPDYYVIAFPVGRERWHSASRSIKALRPGTDGKFSFTAMPAGDYYLGALTDVQQNEWFDPAFLDRLIPAAVKVTLVEGETRVQDLRIRPTERGPDRSLRAPRPW